MATNFHITGIPELDRKLAYLSKDVARKASRSALAVGMTVIRNAIRARVPLKAKTPGHALDAYKESIKGSQKRQRKTGIAEAKVGIAVGKGVFKLRNWQVFHLLALGTADRYTGRKRIRGKVLGKWKWLNIWRKTGNPVHYTGRLQSDDLVKRGTFAAWPTALRQMVNQVAIVVAREAAKKP